ncbi:MAG: hypothetical protein IH819_12355 [Bacteroidetes bacterium]|nr:hypothetical protein [Bacteroidota bacterium]
MPGGKEISWHKLTQEHLVSKGNKKSFIKSSYKINEVITAFTKTIMELSVVDANGIEDAIEIFKNHLLTNEK